MPVREHDVETEIYERLYARPHRDGRDGVTQPLVIVDRPLGAVGGDDVAEPLSPGSSAIPVVRGALVAAGARAREAMADLGPLVAAGSAAARRDPPIAVALAWALVAIPVLALVLASSGRSEPVPPRLLAPRHQALVSAPPAPTPRPAARRASPPAPSAAGAESAAAPAPESIRTTRTTALRPRSPVPTPARHRTVRRTAPAPKPRPSITKPTAHERPAPAPTTTSPGAPQAGSGTSGGVQSP